MANLLESIMLLCFGLSWPISVVKNLKAKTAKSTSLSFILLIIFGYIAGITAKFYSHNINYVLAVYIFNIVMVSANLIVYFINKRYDRQAETAAETTVEPEKNTGDLRAEVLLESETESSMQSSGGSIMEKYKELNSVTETGGILLFGSDYSSSMPLGELAHSFHLDMPIYNRSIKNISIDNIQTYMDVCMFDLHPQKIFINIGESDIKNPDLDIDSFISKYEWMLYTIHTKVNAEIYIVSVISRNALASRINARLKTLADQSGCQYIDAVSALSSERPMLRVFELLKFYFRNRSISFADAMNLVSIGKEAPEDTASSKTTQRGISHHHHPSYS